MDTQTTKQFFQFLGIHSFLIGLFPFFVPVFLWQQGLDLSQVSFFIAVTGIGFVVSLWIWDRIHKQIGFRHIIATSFVIEIILLASVFMVEYTPFLLLFGLLNGAYNCFFWITQRALFFETISPENSGRKFGNFQIFVVVVLKAGIFCGGFMLDKTGYLSVFLVSVMIASGAIAFFMLHKAPPTLPRSLVDDPPLSMASLIRFRDRFGSKTAFIIDGLFLFLESYFWVISLFLLTHESFWKLGLLVILLTVLFSGLFLFIKNSIDTMRPQTIYRIAVAAYAGSWLLRSLVDEMLPLAGLFILLVLITFGTSFFRLAFNKRFFDLAKQTSAHQYLFLKSYYSQFFIALFFSVIGVALHYTAQADQLLSLIYLPAAGLAMLYLLYRPAGESTPPS